VAMQVIYGRSRYSQTANALPTLLDGASTLSVLPSSRNQAADHARDWPVAKSFNYHINCCITCEVSDRTTGVTSQGQGRRPIAGMEPGLFPSAIL
jgi:hypothetical protein